MPFPTLNADTVANINNLRTQQQMMGGGANVGGVYAEPTEGADALEYALNLYFAGDNGGDPQLAQQVAEQSGIPAETFNAAVQKVARESMSHPHGLAGAISGIGNFVKENPAVLLAAPLAIAALTGSFAAGGAAAAGGGSGAGSGAATLSPLTTGPLATGGAITASPIAAGASSLPAITGGAAAATNALGDGNFIDSIGDTSSLGGSWNALMRTAGGGGTFSNLLGRFGDYIVPGVNALLGANAANQASDAQTDALNNSIAEQRRQYDQTRADMLPWLTAGTSALGRLQDPNANFAASPDYEFRRTEGTRGIGNSFAARGGAFSGNALKALDEFNSNLASGEFSSWFNRQASLAGLGQTTASTLGGLGADSAARTGNYLGTIGDARASGLLGRTNQIQNGIYDAYANNRYRNYFGRP